MPAAEALTIFRRLLAAVRTLHSNGRTHRAIGPDAVRLDPAGDATLTAPDPVREFDGSGADPESCPPELFAAGVVRLPAEIDVGPSGVKVLRAGVALDHLRWIDVYQLGALLCRMVTDESVAAYLRSPRTKSKVPTALRQLIDRALGYRAAGRIADCDEYAAVLGEAEAGREQSIETPPHGSAAGFPSNTPPGGPDRPPAPSLPLRPASLSPGWRITASTNASAAAAWVTFISVLKSRCNAGWPSRSFRPSSAGTRSSSAGSGPRPPPRPN